MVDLQAIPYDSTNETGGCVTHGMVWACPTPAGASLLQNLVGSPRPRLNTVFIPCALFLREKGSSGEAHLQSFYGCLTGARIVGSNPPETCSQLYPDVVSWGNLEVAPEFSSPESKAGELFVQARRAKTRNLRRACGTPPDSRGTGWCHHLDAPVDTRRAQTKAFYLWYPCRRSFAGHERRLNTPKHVPRGLKLKLQKKLRK